ncbi:MAG: DUF1559 domain-containing protein [Planctomycetota bacterium]
MNALRRHPDSLIARSGNAFTLLEVLVAVSIVAVLVALLLPALRHAREATRTATCGSNLRQIGLAWDAYERAFDTTPVPTARGAWSFGGAAFVGAERVAVLERSRPINPMLVAASGVRWGESAARFAAVFQCPSDTGLARTSPKGPVSTGRTAFETFGTSYRASAGATGLAPSPDGKSASDVVLAGDAAWYYAGLRPRHPEFGTTAWWHQPKGLANVVAADGSVRGRRLHAD